MAWSAVAAVLLGLAVAFGAFGAHALKARFDAYQMGIWEKAVFYQFVHALGLLIVSLLPKTGALTAPGANLVAALLAAGIVLFSGSLYVLALTGTRGLGMVTPLGGLAFLAGWIVLAWLLVRAPGR